MFLLCLAIYLDRLSHVPSKPLLKISDYFFASSKLMTLLLDVFYVLFGPIFSFLEHATQFLLFYIYPL